MTSSSCSAPTRHSTNARSASTEYRISNKQYAAVAAGSLALAACFVASIRAGYAAVNAAEAQAGSAVAAQATLQTAEKDADAMAVTPASTTDMSAAKAAAEGLLADKDDTACVSARMLDGPGSFEIRDDESTKSTSMIKPPALAEYFDEASSGELSPTDIYAPVDEDVVRGSGTMRDDDADTEYTLGEVARRMIQQSDNLTKNMLIERRGWTTSPRCAMSWGLLAHGSRTS